MAATPYWFATAQPQQFPTLQKALTVDVLVVGGGVTGVTTAYLLRRAG